MGMSSTLVDREQEKFRPGSGPNQSRVAVDVEAGSISSSSGFGTLSPSMPAQIIVGLVSTLLIAANADRKFAYVSNYSGQTVFIEVGAPAALGKGIRLCSGASFIFSGADLWLGDIFGITDSGTPNVNVSEAIT